ncbi:MAG: PocR ligand-binding domain-containing protein [Clostridia bacterium]|nr:PocR ligand-binding domain-containing protein [Clostridia bacterium]
MTKEEIVATLADLHKITGFRISLHSADYGEIAAYPKPKCELCRLIQAIPGEYERCVESDHEACKAAIDKKGAHIYRCRYGMTEAVSPLYNFGTLTGFLMMGQVYEDDADKAHALEALSKKDIDKEALVAALGSIPSADPELVPSFIRIMTVCAQYLTVSHAIPSNKLSVAHLAKEYISLHFHTKISINRICREVGCSKSALITAFKKEYGTTVNAYLNEVRLAESVHLLRQGDMSIGEIALRCGYSDQSYFSKVFSARFGTPPSEWASEDAPLFGYDALPDPDEAIKRR